MDERRLMLGRTIFKFLNAIGVKHSTLNFDALEFAPGNQGNILRQIDNISHNPGRRARWSI